LDPGQLPVRPEEVGDVLLLDGRLGDALAIAGVVHDVRLRHVVLILVRVPAEPQVFMERPREAFVLLPESFCAS
jgi:hypothetical protein